MSQVRIYAAVVDTRHYDQQCLDQRVFQRIQETYLEGGFRRKIWYYFAEREIKQHIEESLQEDYNKDTMNNLFGDKEKNAYAHRCHLAYHYPLDTHHVDTTPFEYVQIEELDRLANEYILGHFGSVEKAVTNLFYTDTTIQRFLYKNNLAIQYSATDVLEQLTLYRANVQFVQFLQKKPDLVALQSEVQAFFVHHHEYPFVMKLLEIGFDDLNVVLTADPKKYLFLLDPIYTIQLRFVPSKQLAGMTESKTIYTSLMAKVGAKWKMLPWYSKILISIVLFGGAAHLGGVSLIILPLLVFLRQFAKSKADIAESMNYHVQRLALDQQYYLKWKSFGQKERKGTRYEQWQYRKLRKARYSSVPSLVREKPWELHTQLTLLITNFTTDKKNLLEVAVLLYHMERAGVPLLSFRHTETKEQDLLQLYKVLIASGTIYGWHLATTQGYETLESQIEYKKYSTDWRKSISDAIHIYQKDSGLKSLMDGIMSGIISGTTGWVSAYFLGTPVTTAASVYATDQTYKVVLDNNHPLWDFLREEKITGALDQDHMQKALSLIDHHAHYVVKNMTIYETGKQVIDTKLSDGLMTIIPDDVRETLLTQLSHSTTDNTLWETLVHIAGHDRGNEIVQKLMDHLRKAQDTSGLSELFVTAQHNGLLTWEMTGAEWDHLERVLHQIYDYKGFENYMQWAGDRSWLAEQITKINEGKISVDDFGKLYNHAQRSVLSHAAFAYIHKEDLADIFYDHTGEEAIGKIVTTSEGVLTGHDIGNMVGSSRWNRLRDGLKDVGYKTGDIVKAIPVTVGRNRVIKKIED